LSEENSSKSQSPGKGEFRKSRHYVNIRQKAVKGDIKEKVRSEESKQEPSTPNQQAGQRTHKPFREQHPAQQNQQSSVSVIIPLLNEEESLPELALQLEGELKKVANNRWEVIFVDDGSTDRSYEVLKRINKMNPKFRAIRFRCNYGKSAALAVGFNEAKGSIILTMDADLQDDPAEIPNLIAKLNEGYDLVSGWKKKRFDPISKTIPSKFFNFVTSTMTGVKLHDFNCGLKAYRRDVVKTIQVYGEMHRYLPALAHWEGFRVSEIPVQHHARRYGKTKFGLTRFLKGFLDLLTLLFTTRYLKRPLHFFGTFGALFAITGFVIDAWLTVEWALGKTALSNRPLALLGIALIIVGVQFVSMGLLGELITKSTIKSISYSIKEKL
jgi:glycosyltransferase involved in cell wall biosynthesis